MVPYILMFGLSCLNFRLAYLLRKYKTIKILFVLIGLLLPCILAGSRDNTIGTVMWVYGDAYLNYAQRLRQSIAMSIIFWGYNYIVERKPIKFCVSVVIAAGFHLTAAIMLLLYPIHRMVTYVQDKDSKNIFSRIIGPYRKLIYALIILLCVAVLFLYSSLLPIIIALTGRFEGQLEFLSGGISMYWPYWLIMLLPIFLLFRRYNVRRSMDEEYSFLYLMFALSIILFQVIGINSESYRISLYFMQFLILLMVKSGCTEYQTFRIILERWCILIFLGAYYVYFFIIALFNHVYPYTSSMLGI